MITPTLKRIKSKLEQGSLTLDRFDYWIDDKTLKITYLNKKYGIRLIFKGKGENFYYNDGDYEFYLEDTKVDWNTAEQKDLLADIFSYLQDQKNNKLNIVVSENQKTQEKKLLNTRFYKKYVAPIVNPPQVR